MLQYFIDRMDDKLNGKLDPCDTRMLVNVGYGETVSPFLATLGGSKGFTHSYEVASIEPKKTVVNVTVNSFRPFHGGMVIVEAHQLDNSNDFWLRVINLKIYHLLVNFLRYQV